MTSSSSEAEKDPHVSRSGRQQTDHPPVLMLSYPEPYPQTPALSSYFKPQSALGCTIALTLTLTQNPTHKLQPY
jgi:hypothetical protein